MSKRKRIFLKEKEIYSVGLHKVLMAAATGLSEPREKVVKSVLHLSGAVIGF
jgi:hypothetical protein